MALPAPSDLPGMDYQDMGRPFIEYSVKGLHLGSMDYQDMGRPFVRNFTLPVASGIKAVKHPGKGKHQAIQWSHPCFDKEIKQCFKCVKFHLSIK